MITRRNARLARYPQHVMRQPGGNAEFKQRSGKMLADEFRAMGRAASLCPAMSNVNLFRYGKRIVDLDTEIADGRLNFGMAKQ